MPPLRDRENDIVDIANNFLVKFSDNKKSFDNSALELLKNYSWPGNVRELENILKRVCALATEKIITEEILLEFLDKEKILLEKNFNLGNINANTYSSLNFL